MTTSDEDEAALARLIERGYRRPAIPQALEQALLRRLEGRLPRRRQPMNWASIAALLATAAALALWVWISRSHHETSSIAPKVAVEVPPPTPERVDVDIFWPQTLNSASRSEKLREVTQKDLLAADCIAVGHFTIAAGKMEFVPERMLKGDAGTARTRANAFAVKAGPKGKLETASPGRVNSWLPDYGATDARVTAIWFFGVENAREGVSRQPAELADGFAALLARKEPDLRFNLLQRLDFDRRWAALEELFAKRPPDVIAMLHEVALRPDSEAAYDAIGDLVKTRLLDPEKFWGKWFNLPDAWLLRDSLLARNPTRTLAELKAAIKSEKDASRLEALLDLIPYGAQEKLELVLPYLDHPSASIRETAVGRVWDFFWDLNDKAAHSPEAKAKLEALAPRVVPLLEQRLKVETDPATLQRLTQLLAKQNGVPWLLRIPQEVIHEPIPPYSDAEEQKILISCLTSTGGRTPGDFIRVSAGREIAEHFLEDGYARLKSAANSKGIYNTDIVYDGMGYVRAEPVFDDLAKTGNMRAIGTQDNKRSLVVMKEYVATKVKDKYEFENMGIGLVDGLGALHDPGTLAYLKELEPRIEYHCKVPYLRARAIQGDKWAVAELLDGLAKPPASKFLGEDFWSRGDVIEALCFVDTPEATAALKAYVVESWPTLSDGDDLQSPADLENYAGPSRRTSPLGEVARRDPQWLAGLALQKMATTSWAARSFGEDIFHQLTGHIGAYHADAFASERAAALKDLQTWWTTHQHESREQWLTAYFQEKGFAIQRLDKSALPVLLDAMNADFWTYNLAVEQISAICRKYFVDFRHYQSYQGQEQMEVRISGWLRARGWMKQPPEK